VWETFPTKNKANWEGKKEIKYERKGGARLREEDRRRKAEFMHYGLH
jgi:hypothetical protein